MVNGLVESHAEYTHMLDVEVSRLELMLVAVYLHEHPEVALPARLERELSELVGSTAAQETVDKLRSLRNRQV